VWLCGCVCVCVCICKCKCLRIHPNYVQNIPTNIALQNIHCTTHTIPIYIQTDRYKHIDIQYTYSLHYPSCSVSPLAMNTHTLHCIHSAETHMHVYTHTHTHTYIHTYNTYDYTALHYTTLHYTTLHTHIHTLNPHYMTLHYTTHLAASATSLRIPAILSKTDATSWMLSE
jgi:hypothetical protein